MSAVWVKLAAVLCVSCRALSAVGVGEVQWRHLGGSLTIQCDCSNPNQEFLDLKKGLSKDVQVLFKKNKGDKRTIAKEFHGRIEINGRFPKMDILITNLTLNDTGPYWCTYKKFDNYDSIITVGNGSVLLVVKENVLEKEVPNRTCDSSKETLILVCVVISAAVLLSVIMGILVWLIKTKTAITTAKPRRVPNNDVYEDMRGTLRR